MSILFASTIFNLDFIKKSLYYCIQIWHILHFSPLKPKLKNYTRLKFDDVLCLKWYGILQNLSNITWTFFFCVPAWVVEIWWVHFSKCFIYSFIPRHRFFTCKKLIKFTFLWILNPLTPQKKQTLFSSLFRSMY